MDNQELTVEEKKIKDLEARNFILEKDMETLALANSKLGYSTRLMSEFHLTQDDKANIANSLDIATNIKEVEAVYNEYHKMLHNKALGEESADFQMSQDFKDNIRLYYAVSLGYDPISKIAENISKITSYFNLENKIRSTPKAEIREPMVDTLMKSRPDTVEAVDNIVNIVNSFNKEES